jgi:hypothetical protein
MSTIDTNGIDPNYPVPGVNNSSQGFRDNFSSIKVNFDAAATEITDLQNKVVVKSALTGSVVDNNMANTLISNALVRSFRATTFNLGNNISGTATIDVSRGDVQYGTIVGNTTLNFGGWSPSSTQSNLQIQLTVANANAVISFPITTNDANAKPVIGMTKSVSLLENYTSNVASPIANSVYTNKITAPYNTKNLAFNITTTDCGVTMDIEPLSRPQKATQVMGNRTIAAIGAQGDVPGALATDGGNLYFCIGTYDGSSVIWKKVTLGNV